jgi:CpeS-like protein
MDIKEFFEQSAGKWFSHRTNYDLVDKQSREAKSEIIIENLPVDNPEVVQLCQLYNVKTNQVSCAAKFNWNDTTKLNQKLTGSTVVVFLPDTDNNSGQLLRQGSLTANNSTNKFINNSTNSINNLNPGRYLLGSDECLTLVIEDDGISIEERLWFASPNLRMRVSVTKYQEGFSTSAFTTEIRMGGSPQPAKTSVTNSVGS